jgi:hypothetical protein
VISNKGAISGLSLINAESFTNPFGPPTLQVSSEYWSELKEYAREKKKFTLKINIEREKTKAYNVIARLKGSIPELPPLFIITSRSGWWHCASERGGGIICLLEMMRTILSNKPKRNVFFMANSGH